jgi:hypothetical protein
MTHSRPHAYMCAQKATFLCIEFGAPPTVTPCARGQRPRHSETVPRWWHRR